MNFKSSLTNVALGASLALMGLVWGRYTASAGSRFPTSVGSTDCAPVSSAHGLRKEGKFDLVLSQCGTYITTISGFSGWDTCVAGGLETMARLKQVDDFTCLYKGKQ